MPRAIPLVACWFKLEDDPFGGEVEVVHLSDLETADIREQVEDSQNFFDFEAGKMRNTTKINTVLDRKLTTIKCVRSWKNFMDADGKPMECTPENKAFWACNNDFMNQLRGFRHKVAETAKEQQEAALGNLSSSASGSPASDVKTATTAAIPLEGETKNQDGT